MQIQWRTHFDLSAMHAAWCLSRFSDRARGCSDAMHLAAQEFCQMHAGLNVALDDFWDSALTLCVNCQANQQLASRMLLRLGGAGMRSPSRVSELSMRIAALENAFRRDFPNHGHEIALRTEPLKQLWEGHGPGLLRLIGKLTVSTLLVESAEVFLVQPIVGGLGYAHLMSNRVHMEGLLTNVDPRLPETVRLAWLLAQLDLERAVHSEMVDGGNVRRLSGLAMIPPTLVAANDLELGFFSLEGLEAAIELWQLADQGASPRATAEVLLAWWETYQAAQPPWSTAMAGLGRMLE